MTRASVTHYFIDMTAVSYPDLARILNKASGRDNIMIFYDKSCSLVKIKMLTGKHEKLNISYHDSGHDIHAYLASCMGFVLGAAQYLNDRYVVIADGDFYDEVINLWRSEGYGVSKYELSHEDDALMNMIIDACGENGESVYKYKNKIRNIVRDYNMSLLPDKDKNRHLVRRLYEVDAGYGKILCGVAYKYIHENGNPCQVAPN